MVLAGRLLSACRERVWCLRLASPRLSPRLGKLREALTDLAQLQADAEAYVAAANGEDQKPPGLTHLVPAFKAVLSIKRFIGMPQSLKS